jgi:hypothetical protein
MADLRALQNKRSQVLPFNLPIAQQPSMQPMMTTASTLTPRERQPAPSAAIASSASAAKAASLVLSSPPRATRRPSRVLTSSHASPRHGASAAAAADSTLPGYTVIDIRSLPPSVTASPDRSLAASPAASPAPSVRKSRLRVDTQQLLAAAEEENVSPRTALFLAMKAKAKAEKKRAKKLKEREERKAKDASKEEKKEQPDAAPHPLAQQLLSSRPATASISSGNARLRTRESREAASSLSSSLYSLSLSPELSSLSSSRPRSPSVSLLSDDDSARTERRLKRSERKNGYKLCKVSGCLEARDREGHTKYCKEHQGIHTQNNPNERKGQQRLADRGA